MRGIWAAALNPFNDDLSLNEAGLRFNIRHWIDDLDIQGLFIAGKQGDRQAGRIFLDEPGGTQAQLRNRGRRVRW